MNESGKPLAFDKAKRYSSIKYTLAILEAVFTLSFLLVFLGLGFSKALSDALATSIPMSFFILPAYLFVASFIYYLMNFPLNFYRSYMLEHQFCLSNQTLRSWFIDQIKAGLLSYTVSLILLSVFYFILNRYQDIWWLMISLFWIFFSLVIAKLVPIMVIPLFFKYKKIEDSPLRARIMDLAAKMKIKILDCFEIDFSKKTLKANAAFVGWGATKRVILADTLKDKYSLDEITVILAHEFAHFKRRHLLKLLLVNASVTLFLFYLIFKTSGYALGRFGLISLQDLAALPLVLVYFVLFGLMTQPFENYVSRRLEVNADRMALEGTGLKEAFISMMEKLAAQNLADKNPHPVIKFFFFDHPSADERIAMAKSWA